MGSSHAFHRFFMRLHLSLLRGLRAVWRFPLNIRIFMDSADGGKSQAEVSGQLPLSLVLGNPLLSVLKLCVFVFVDINIPRRVLFVKHFFKYFYKNIFAVFLRKK